MNDRLPEQLFVLVPVFVLVAIIGWVLVPLGRFLHFLAAGAELARNRMRAVGSTLAALVMILAVFEHILKVLLEIFSIITGLKYHILRHRAIPVKRTDAVRWRAVWKACNG